jgi:hypothetical protein
MPKETGRKRESNRGRMRRQPFRNRIKEGLPTPRPKIPGRPHDTVMAAEIKPLLLATELSIADIETLDQPASHLEDVDHQFVGQEITLEVTHYLVNLDNDFPLSLG